MRWFDSVIFLLTGCAMGDTYWLYVQDPVSIKGVIEVERPGGRDLLGFANFKTRNVEVKSGLRAVLRDCVISHEKRHFAGYAHDSRPGFVVDCGDGTMVSP